VTTVPRKNGGGGVKPFGHALGSFREKVRRSAVCVSALPEITTDPVVRSRWLPVFKIETDPLPSRRGDCLCGLKLYHYPGHS
jgi:hypothetical protein